MENMTIKEIIKDSRESGDYFFQKGTVEFWETELMSDAKKNMFVTKDRINDDEYGYYLRYYNEEQQRVWTIAIKETLDEVLEIRENILAGKGNYCQKFEDYRTRTKLKNGRE